MTSEEIKKIAFDTLDIESNTIKELKNHINNDFIECIKFIYNSTGRVVVSGIGKSAIIAQKIVATLNSTGTPAIYMHAADAIHGDLGIIQPDDVVICISKSGNTPEIKILVPFLKNLGSKLIAICSQDDSYLAKQADFLLYAPIDKEACTNNLAPTASTTAHLAFGDALAVTLLEYRGFTEKDFAKYHPGGALGKQLYMRISDLYTHNALPTVKPNDNLRSVILEISSKRLGAAAVIDEEGKLIGIITDGDLRRMLENNTDVSNVKASEIMTKNPMSVDKDLLAAEALTLMKSKNITQVIVTEEGKVLGFVHLHDILKEGIL